MGLERDRRARRHGRSRRSGSSDGPHGSVALANAATPAELPAVRRGFRSVADAPFAVDADEALVDGLDDRRVAPQTLDLRIANGAWVSSHRRDGRARPEYGRCLQWQGLYAMRFPPVRTSNRGAERTPVWKRGGRMTAVEPPRGTRRPFGVPGTARVPTSRPGRGGVVTGRRRRPGARPRGAPRRRATRGTRARSRRRGRGSRRWRDGLRRGHPRSGRSGP